MKYWFNNPAVLSIHWIFREIFWKCAFFFQGRQANLKGHSQLWDRADLDTGLAYYLNLKSNTYLNTCTSRNLLQSSLVFHLIFDIFDTENLFLSISLHILYWLKTVWIACLVIFKSGKKWYVMLISMLAMLVIKNKSISLRWELNAIFMQILQEKILLYWPPIWPPCHVVANQE